MALHLPIVVHAEVTAPADRVRCDRFSTILTAEACAGRTLALKLKPGHRRSGKVMASVARYAPCARCPLGAEARARLAIAGQPGRPEDLKLDRLDLETPERAPVAERQLSTKDEARLVAQGWTRDGAVWRDQHGDAYRPEAARLIALRDRFVYVSRRGMGAQRAGRWAA